MKNNIFCHNCEEVISYKQKAWSKNDGEQDMQPLYELLKKLYTILNKENKQ